MSILSPRVNDTRSRIHHLFASFDPRVSVGRSACQRASVSKITSFFRCPSVRPPVDTISEEQKPKNPFISFFLSFSFLCALSKPFFCEPLFHCSKPKSRHHKYSTDRSAETKIRSEIKAELKKRSEFIYGIVKSLGSQLVFVYTCFLFLPWLGDFEDPLLNM